MRYTKLRRVAKKENRIKDKFHSFEFDYDDLELLVTYLNWTIKTAGSKSSIGNIEMIIPGPWSHDTKKKKLVAMAYHLGQIYAGNRDHTAEEVIDELAQE